MKTYHGTWDPQDPEVTVHGAAQGVYKLPVVHHRSKVHNWGFVGTSAGQLGWDLLYDHTGSVDVPTRLAAAFTDEVVAYLPHQGPFTLTGEQIQAWINSKP